MHVSNYERRNVEVRRAELVTGMFERFAVTHNILRREKYCIDNKYNMPIYGFSVKCYKSNTILCNNDIYILREFSPKKQDTDF